MPSSAAVTVIVVSPWMTRPFFEEMPSLELPVTVSSPVPVMVRSSEEERAAVGASSEASE